MSYKLNDEVELGHVFIKPLSEKQNVLLDCNRYRSNLFVSSQLNDN